jgi:hypothetical protein
VILALRVSARLSTVENGNPGLPPGEKGEGVVPPPPPPPKGNVLTKFLICANLIPNPKPHNIAHKAKSCQAPCKYTLAPNLMNIAPRGRRRTMVAPMITPCAVS